MTSGNGRGQADSLSHQDERAQAPAGCCHHAGSSRPAQRTPGQKRGPEELAERVLGSPVAAVGCAGRSGLSAGQQRGAPFGTLAGGLHGRLRQETHAWRAGALCVVLPEGVKSRDSPFLAHSVNRGAGAARPWQLCPFCAKPGSAMPILCYGRCQFRLDSVTWIVLPGIVGKKPNPVYFILFFFFLSEKYRGRKRNWEKNSLFNNLKFHIEIQGWQQ